MLAWYCCKHPNVATGLNPLLLFLFLTACGGGGSGGSGPHPPSPEVITPLTLRAALPEPGDTCVGTTNASVSAIFTTDIDATTLNTNSFVVREANGGAVVGSVQYSNRTAIFRPATPLKHRQYYNVSLSNGIRDTRGNAFSGYGWSFSTVEATASGNYRACWQAVDDSRVTGYRVYWGQTTPLTTQNSAGSREIPMPTAELSPTELGAANNTIYMAVQAYSATATEIDSPLSSEVTVVIGQ